MAKYDFKGIKDKGARAILLALDSVPSIASIFTKLPFVRLIADKFLEFAVNWLANKGLIVINIPYFIVDGHVDQKRFDESMEEGIARAKIPGLSDKEKKVIDDKVIEAIRKFGRINKYN